MPVYAGVLVKALRILAVLAFMAAVLLLATDPAPTVLRQGHLDTLTEELIPLIEGQQGFEFLVVPTVELLESDDFPIATAMCGTDGKGIAVFRHEFLKMHAKAGILSLSRALRYTLVHELAHALDIQRYTKEATPAPPGVSELAWSSLWEGHAELVALQIARKEGFGEEFVAWAEARNSSLEGEDSRRHRVTYILGRRFCEYMVESRGNDFLKDLSTSPPLIPFEIQHPEHYGKPRAQITPSLLRMHFRDVLDKIKAEARAGKRGTRVTPPYAHGRSKSTPGLLRVDVLSETLLSTVIEEDLKIDPVAVKITEAPKSDVVIFTQLTDDDLNLRPAVKYITGMKGTDNELEILVLAFDLETLYAHLVSDTAECP